MRTRSRIARDTKLLTIFFSLLISIFVISGAAYAVTYVSGTISADTTWASANSPYVVNGTVTVASGVTLNIEPGTVIKFSGSGSGLTIDGTLTADGTPQQLIIFTSIKDDTYGGDTNGDGSSSSPARGDWNTLSFSATSTNNLLDNVIVRYGGYSYPFANIYIQTSSSTISNSTVENGDFGIRTSNASPTITGNVIRNNSNSGIYLTNSPGTTITGNSISGNGNVNGGYPIYLDSSSVNSTASISGNTITGNYRYGIWIANLATLTTSATWVSDAPYIFNSLTVYSGVTLTIEPGTVVKFSNSSSGLTINGTLTADGTPQQPIIFTSIKDDAYGGDTNGDGSSSIPSRGNWRDLNFTSSSINSLLDNVIVRYGGYSYPYATIYVQTSSLTISNSTVENSTFGIRASNASPTITGNVIRNNSNSGISLNNSPGTIITGNSISGNGYESGNYSIYLDSLSVNSTGSINGNTITGNYRNGIWIATGATLTTSATWVADAPYIVSSLTVSSGVTLTIEPGTVVKISSSGSLLTIDGTLTADGTPQQPIIFTSIKDDAYGGDTNGDGSNNSPSRGNWMGLSFTSSSINSLLDNVIVRYGGDSSYANIKIQTSLLTISNSTIENGVQGISVMSASPTITGNVIRNNSNIGISLNNSPGTTITGNSISGNGSYAIYKATSSPIVIAENNYWGDASGPYDPSDDRASGGWYNPNGTGDRVSDYVDYDPWLGSFPQCVDSDGDGYGVLENLICPNGPQTDCDDSDPLEHPNQTWYMDIDSDGYSSGLFLIQCVRPAGAYKALSELTDLGDCDDADPGINPDTYWYPDNDGDGYGNAAISLQQCNQPGGYVPDNTDCDDNDTNIYPGGPGVRILDTPPAYSLTLQEGYDAALDGDTMQSKAYLFYEDTLLFDQNKSVNIESGYDCGYMNNTGTSTVNGNVTINDGAVTIQTGTFKVQ